MQPPLILLVSVDEDALAIFGTALRHFGFGVRELNDPAAVLEAGRLRTVLRTPSVQAFAHDAHGRVYFGGSGGVRDPSARALIVSTAPHPASRPPHTMPVTVLPSPTASVSKVAAPPARETVSPARRCSIGCRPPGRGRAVFQGLDLPGFQPREADTQVPRPLADQPLGVAVGGIERGRPDLRTRHL